MPPVPQMHQKLSFTIHSIIDFICLLLLAELINPLSIFLPSLLMYEFRYVGYLKSIGHFEEASEQLVCCSCFLLMLKFFVACCVVLCCV